jgi:pimeloyl-ACP methyl ester carboxylesterase
MANTLDYIDWRGDLGFEVSPFNEVDNILLCKLVCPDFTGIITPPEAEGGVSAADAVKAYLGRHTGRERIGLLAPKKLLPMLAKLPDSERYKSIVLSDYINKIDIGLEEQFSALTCLLPDGTRFVTFRGTDDTLVAWKENLNMSIMESVPAQRDAAAYLEGIMRKYGEPVRVGGHSKGGNLAVYAALRLPPEYHDRLLRVYNNDGPGFREPILNTEEYRRIRSKICTFVPQYSLVGMLLSHEEDYEIVKSRETGIMAHDGLTWEVLGTKFIRARDFSLRGKIMNSAVRSWISGLNDEQRRLFISDLYSVLASTGASTLTELTENKLRQSARLIQKLRAEPESLAFLSEALELLIKEYVNSALEVFPRPKLPFAGKK